MPVLTLEVNNSGEPVCLERASFDVPPALNNLEGLWNLNPGGSEAHTLLFLNIASRKVSERAASVLETDVTEELEQIVNLLSIRGYIFTEGHCILPESAKEKVGEFATYAETHGLVPENSMANVVWVKDSLDFALVMQTVAEVAKQSEKQIKLEPYQYTMLLRELAMQTGASLRASPDDLVSKLSDQFASKIAYCNFIEELFPGQIPFPRLSYEADKQESISAAELAQKLRDVLEYSERYSHDYANEGPKRVLFMRAAYGAGGFGNTIVYQLEDGKLFTQNGTEESRKYFKSEAELAQHIRDTAGDLEITPFVNVRGQKTYSFGIMLTDEAITVSGPREQVLNQDGAFQGWKRDIDPDAADMRPCDKLVNFHDEMKKALLIGVKLHEMGYRGNLSRDMFEFLDPEGNRVVTDAEVNARRDGTGFFFGVIARMGLLEDYLSGNLSVITNDHLKLSSTYATATPSELAAVLSESGVKMMTKNDPYGVVMLTPCSVTGEIAMGICARSDSERDLYYEKLKHLTQSSPDFSSESVTRQSVMSGG